MKGFVPTPQHVVDLMVGKLFGPSGPGEGVSVLDPGCGNGEFIEGILRACALNNWPVPRIVGVELDPDRESAAQRKFHGNSQVQLRRGDFLAQSSGKFDFVIGNPPYVSITSLTPSERATYRAEYRTASGRFDLYLLFFEQALRLLAPGGRLVFITPEKFLYVETARPLRELLRAHHVEELEFTSEVTFPARVAYPLITTVVAKPPSLRTRVVRRDGSVTHVAINESTSWLPIIEGFASVPPAVTLADVALRISCGVATGADAVFVLPSADLSPELERFAHATIAGRQITPARDLVLESSLLAPYDSIGRLLPESQLGALGSFLNEPDRRKQLERRTCVGHKPWYAFHDNLPLGDILRPKLLCKDITETPFFVIDRQGQLVPRHSVYYIVPADPSDLDALAEYLNSEAARDWLRVHCQRAANGFLRLQSHVLKKLPLPAQLRPDSVPEQPDLLEAELLPA